MFCSKCGSQQTDNARFCGACGAQLAGSMPTTPQPAAVPRPSPRLQAPPAAPPETAEAPAASVDSWTVTCDPPDDDGNSTFRGRAVVVFSNPGAAHLARLRWIAYESSGRFPLAAGEADVMQDIDEGDDVELEAWACVDPGAASGPDACQVRGQVVLFPGEPETVLSVPLPDADSASGTGPAWGGGHAEITGWRVVCGDSSDDNASYSMRLVVRNSGRAALAAVTGRVRILSRKGEVWSAEHFVAEAIAAGETRVVERTISVAERARARKGATLEVVGIASRRAEVLDLATITPSLEPAQPDSDASAGGGDTGSRSVTYHFTACILTSEVAQILDFAGEESWEPFPAGEEIDLLYDYSAEQIVGARSSAGVLFGAECTTENLERLIAESCPLALAAGLTTEEILYMASPPNSKVPSDFPGGEGYTILVEWGGDARQLSGEELRKSRKVIGRARGGVWMTQRSWDRNHLHSAAEMEEGIDSGEFVAGTNDYCFLFK